ncbi:RNA polymerase sigma factor [Novosphingobium aquimarinum]|uniref:RNA polymerase sigma factor n=1 Tax=Novosphingobium aquimarinum TaxID=2682494 RepID=UPI0012EB2551|nr:sigma-70 family RNA polymerase sigma factor [Novosphingobium aquimarinum]
MTAPPTDTDLVRGALSGQAPAQQALVERHRDFVYRLIRNATGHAEDAFDLTQETFIAAFTALGRFDTQQSFRAWIGRIALNKSRDWARRRTVRRFLGLSMPEAAEDFVSDDAPLPDQIASGRAELAAVAKAIAQLSPRLKDVLLLRTVEGLTQAETAMALGITEKAVETRLYRARQKLTEMLRGNDRGRV